MTEMVSSEEGEIAVRDGEVVGEGGHFGEQRRGGEEPCALHRVFLLKIHMADVFVSKARIRVVRSNKIFP